MCGIGGMEREKGIEEENYGEEGNKGPNEAAQPS
jgi:hypothetical protein